MQTKKEQVRAHTYVGRRLARAILTGDPDGYEQPMRRTSIGTIIGIVLAVIIVLGFLVFGLIRPGDGPVLSADTTVVVEENTGTRFLVVDGTLRPVPNLASAMLALGGPTLKIQELSSERTAALPRGPALGISGAPDDVPPAEGLADSTWSACVTQTSSVTGLPPTLGIAFGVGSGGEPSPIQLDDAAGLLVSGASGASYLVAGGRRYPFASETARNALGYVDQVPLRVPDAWLASLAPGRPLATLTVDGLGEPGPPVAGTPTQVGQILEATSLTSEPQYYLVERDAIVTLTQVEERELMANPEVAALNTELGGPLGVSVETVGDAERRPFSESAGWPETTPAPVDPDGAQVCVVGGSSSIPWVGLQDQAEDPDPTADPPGGVEVSVAPGSAALVEPVDGVGAGSGQVSLVDDLGRLYDIADGDTLAALGLDQAERTPIPSGLLAVIPRGPVLSIAEVRGGSSLG